MPRSFSISAPSGSDCSSFAVPRLARAVVVRDGGTLAGRGQYDAVMGAAHSNGVALTPVDVNDTTEIERAIVSSAGSKDCGVIVTAGSLAAGKRKWIVELARQQRVPGVYPNRMYATDGGLIAYGPITVELYRTAPATSTALSGRVRSRATSRSSRRANMSWISTCTPPGHRSSRCRQHFSPLQTGSLIDEQRNTTQLRRIASRHSCSARYRPRLRRLRHGLAVHGAATATRVVRILIMRAAGIRLATALSAGASESRFRCRPPIRPRSAMSASSKSPQYICSIQSHVSAGRHPIRNSEQSSAHRGSGAGRRLG